MIKIIRWLESTRKGLSWWARLTRSVKRGVWLDWRYHGVRVQAALRRDRHEWSSKHACWRACVRARTRSPHWPWDGGARACMCEHSRFRSALKWASTFSGNGHSNGKCQAQCLMTLCPCVCDGMGSWKTPWTPVWKRFAFFRLRKDARRGSSS